MKILPPIVITSAADVLFLSRKRARSEIRAIYPRDLYSGMDLDNSVWSLEHVVPQSRIRSPGKKNDLHNLSGIHTRINGIRGNKKFGDPSLKHKNLMGCKISPSLFSPRVGKGEVARKCAYMIDSYGQQIEVPSVIDADTMMEWNYMYPPGDDEKRRNELIFEIQGTFNKFVEDPSSLQETLYWREEKKIHKIPRT